MSKIIRNKIWRLRSNGYVKLLFLLGAFSIPFLSSCRSREIQADDPDRISDSIRNSAYHDSVAKVRADSVNQANLDKERMDSVRRADSIKNANSGNQNNYVPNHPVTKYGIPVE